MEDLRELPNTYQFMPTEYERVHKSFIKFFEQDTTVQNGNGYHKIATSSLNDKCPNLATIITVDGILFEARLSLVFIKERRYLGRITVFKGSGKDAEELLSLLIRFEEHDIYYESEKQSLGLLDNPWTLLTLYALVVDKSIEKASSVSPASVG